MHIVLPQESTGRKLDFIRLLHPGTSQPAKFLVDQASDAPHSLYELTKVGSDARSALIDDRVSSDGSLVVATPLHPLFILLPVLYTQRNKPLPLDTLLDLCGNDESDSLPEDMVSPHIPSVCENPIPGLVSLDLAKLKTFLDGRVGRVRAGLPPMVRSEVVRAIQPIDPSENPSPELLDAAETYAAVSMLITSWMSPELQDWFLSTYDFSELESAALKLHEQHAALQGMQFANNGNGGDTQTNKRINNEPKPAAKKPKTIQAKNNTSILDMFKRK